MNSHLSMVILAVLVAASFGKLHAQPVGDVGQYRSGLEQTAAEFGLCTPIDQKSVGRGWRYVLRYVHNDPASGASFSLMLMRSTTPNQFVLALHEGKGFTFAQLDEASDAEKLRLAKSTKSIDQALAQVLYEAWLRALVRATPLGVGSLAVSTGSEYYYISVFSIETGYLSARSDAYASGKTTGIVRDAGLLLRRYLDEKSPEIGRQLEDQVRKLCSTIPTGRS